MSRILSASLLLVFSCIVLSTELLSQEQIWYRSFKGGIYDIERLPNEDILLVGTSLPFKAVPSAHYSGYVARVDTAGNTVWERAFSSYYEIYPRFIHLLANGNFLVIGNGRLTDTSSLDYYVATLNGDGLLLTEQLIQDPDGQYAYTVKQLPDGGFLTVGPTDLFKAEIGRFDSSGNHMWTRGYTRPDTVDSFSDAVVLPDGRILAMGESTFYGDSNDFQVAILLWMFTENGDSLWVRNIDMGHVEREKGRAIFRRDDGGFIIIATEYGVLTSGILLHVDSTGILESRRTIKHSSTGTDIAFARKRDGVIDVYGIGRDPTLGSLSFNGDLLYTTSYPTVTGRLHYPLDDLIEPSGSRYIAGHRNGTNFLEGFLLKIAGGRSAVPVNLFNPLMFGLW